MRKILASELRGFIVGRSSEVSNRSWTPKKKRQLYWLAAAILIVVVGQSLVPDADPPEEIPYSTFLKLVEDGSIASVEIHSTEIQAKTTDGTTMSAQRIPELDDEGLLELLKDRSIEFSGESSEAPWWPALFAWLLPIGFLLLIFSMLSRGLGTKGGPLSFGKSEAKIFDRSDELRTTSGSRDRRIPA